MVVNIFTQNKCGSVQLRLGFQDLFEKLERQVIEESRVYLYM